LRSAGLTTAKMFWWFNQHANVDYYATPKPHYGCDGSKVFGILDHTDCDLESHLGRFPFHTFWGPMAGIACSDWIADATARVMRQQRPIMTLCYLPHLDYDLQRFDPSDPDVIIANVRQVDAAAQRVIAAAHEIDAKVIVVSEYGLVPVHRPVMINRVLGDAGWLSVRDGPFGQQMMPGECDAFAVADHQLAHVYVRDSGNRDAVQRLLESTPGIASVVDPGELQLDHPRSGDLVAAAEPDAWFTYYFWDDDRNCPDYARTVDIHRKPGYDPCELFMTSRVRAALRLLQKKVGMRYRMDVIPLDPSRVRGSHGLHSTPQDGPVFLSNAEIPPPDSLLDVRDCLKRIMMG
ncbi:MAG: alkaline phosphatase family protein, partial [Planctomycetota bacterium]